VSGSSSSSFSPSPLSSHDAMPPYPDALYHGHLPVRDVNQYQYRPQNMVEDAQKDQATIPTYLYVHVGNIHTMASMGNQCPKPNPNTTSHCRTQRSIRDLSSPPLLFFVSCTSPLPKLNATSQHNVRARARARAEHGRCVASQAQLRRNEPVGNMPLPHLHPPTSRIAGEVDICSRMTSKGLPRFALLPDRLIR
jgi:hypothetical protein